MIVIQTTRKAADVVSAPLLQPIPDEVGFSRLGHWTMNQVMLGTRSALFFMNDKTTVAFPILEGRRKILMEDIPDFFAHGVSQLLPLLNLPQSFVDELRRDATEIILAKSTNRSTLGVLNAQSSKLDYLVRKYGGMDKANLSELLVRLNTTPQNTLNWATGQEAIYDVLSQRDA